MSNVFDLDSLREELENKYAPLKFEADGETYVLQSLLRISKERRTRVLDAMKALRPEDEEDSESDGKIDVDLSDDDLDEDAVMSAVKTILASVVQGPDGRGRALVDLLGDDLLLHMRLLQKWQEVTQPGEAQDSPS